jgi:hypothetical protein
MTGVNLWHYTCDHGHAAIEDVVVPACWQRPDLDGTPGTYAWFTDLAEPIRDALGLTSNMLDCDRTAHRYRVLDASPIVPWVRVRRSWPSWVDLLESAPGARPMHWFVSPGPVDVEYAPIEVRA